MYVFWMKISVWNMMFSISSGSTVLKYSLARSSMPDPDLQIKLSLGCKSFRTGRLIRNLFMQDASQLLFGTLSKPTSQASRGIHKPDPLVCIST